MLFKSGGYGVFTPHRNHPNTAMAGDAAFKGLGKTPYSARMLFPVNL
jgi:hypothetical protein